MATERFGKSRIKTDKASRGRTDAAATPVAIRSRVALKPGTEERLRRRLGRQLGHAATQIERGTIRFEDVNGPRGGVDTTCRIKLVISGRPSVQVSANGTDPEEAFAQALPALVRTFERMRGKQNLSAGRRRGAAADRAEAGAGGNGGEIIGRRVGRGPEAVASALERPEKARRDAYVDTSMPGTTETDRKAGGPGTARRNSRGRNDAATVTLEDSRTRPSRKSTRKSANRGKPSQGKERTAVAASVTPTARARRAAARRH